MKNRSILGVILFPMITFGIYALYWLVVTKDDLNNKGANIPTALLLIVPFVNIYWLWKYFEGAEKVTGGKTNGILMFVLALFVTILIPMALCQDAYNKMSAGIGSVTPASPITA